MLYFLLLCLVFSSSVTCTNSVSRPFRHRHFVQPKPRHNLDGEPLLTEHHEVAVLIPEGRSRAEEFGKQWGFTSIEHIVDGYYLLKRHGSLREEPHNLRDAGLHFQEMVPVKMDLKSSAGRSAHPVNEDPLAITDRGYEQQWHLHGRTAWNTYYPVNLDAPGAWSQRATGRNVRIGIVDDGLGKDHLDIAPNYDPLCSHSFTKTGEAANDPTPGSTDRHGTACAGLAAGAKDGSVCGVGVAPDATICGLQLLPQGAMATDANIAKAIMHSAQGNHFISVKSYSWGPSDSGRVLGYVGPMTQRALYNTTVSGRNGLGMVHVWAGGNGAPRDQSNFDGYANSVYTIAVGAVDNDGYASYYTEPGFNILVCAPSSGGTLSLYTDYFSDRNTQCTNEFGGTSGAAPQIAGLIALIIQANPRLGERDIRAILVQSAQERMEQEVSVARSTGFDESSNHPARALRTLSTREAGQYDWIVNGAGLSYSPLYGFGLPNASRAVELAMHWENYGPGAVFSRSVPVPEDKRLVRGSEIEIYTVDLRMSDTMQVYTIEEVELDVSLNFGSSGGAMKDIDHISLESPDGTRSRLLWSNIEPATSADWTFMSEAHRGEHPSGQWTVRIRNKGRDTTTVNGLTLHIHGRARESV